MPDVLAQATVVVSGQVDPSIGADVAKAFDNVDDAIADAAQALQKVQTAVDSARAETTRAFGELSESSNLARDGFGDLSTAAAAVGAGLASTGLISEDTAAKFTGVGDALGGVEGAFTAVKGASALAGSAITSYGGKLAKLPGIQQAVTLAQKALNLVMKANPIGLVITAITLLVAGLILAYKKSDTFRAIVNKAFAAIKSVAIPTFNAVKNAVKTAFDFILSAGRSVKSFFSTIWDGVSGAARLAFNGLLSVLRPVAAVINKLIDGFNAVTAVTGGPHLGHIPKFASGVRDFRGGLALVGEQGPELLSLPKGSDVYSNQDTRRIAAETGKRTNNYNFYGPTSLSEGRRRADWDDKYGSRFGAANMAGAR